MSDEPLPGADRLLEAFDVFVARVADRPPGMFILQGDLSSMRPELLERVNAAWKMAWERSGYQPPGLLVIDMGFRIAPLADAQLERLGLQRILRGGP